MYQAQRPREHSGMHQLLALPVLAEQLLAAAVAALYDSPCTHHIELFREDTDIASAAEACVMKLNCCCPDSRVMKGCPSHIHTSSKACKGRHIQPLHAQAARPSSSTTAPSSSAATHPPGGPGGGCCCAAPPGYGAPATCAMAGGAGRP